MTIINSIESLEAIYGQPGEASLVKEIDHVNKEYRVFIEASPFCTLATIGPEGLDCSPRGDVPGFVRVHDEHTLMMPDRRGNNRIDTLKNIVRDDRVAMCFLIPGSRTTLRVNGTAQISVDPELKTSFAEQNKEPRSVIFIKPQAVYFQCGRAIVRSKLWDEESRIDPQSVPTPGEMLAAVTKGKVGGTEYDAAWEERAKKTLW